MTDANKTYRTGAHPAFRFKVTIAQKDQAAFTECSLPSIECEVEEIKEGGLNTYIHQLPSRHKSGKVTLKRGVGKSDLLTWYLESMGEKFTRKNVTITLLDTSLKPLISWDLANAYPVKMSGPDLKTDSNSIAIQSLELAFGLITVKLL